MPVLSPFWCRRFDLSPFWFGAVLTIPQICDSLLRGSNLTCKKLFGLTGGSAGIHLLTCHSGQIFRIGTVRYAEGL